MKKISVILMVLALLIGCIGATAETFEGVGTGNGGDIKVSVTVEDGKITGIDVLEQNETFDSDSLYVVFDVNNLKRINDRFGHLEGDRALRLVADVLKQHVDGEHCYASRWGGCSSGWTFGGTGRRFAPWRGSGTARRTGARASKSGRTSPRT